MDLCLFVCKVKATVFYQMFAYKPTSDGDRESFCTQVLKQKPGSICFFLLAQFAEFLLSFRRFSPVSISCSLLDLAEENRISNLPKMILGRFVDLITKSKNCFDSEKLNYFPCYLEVVDSWLIVVRNGAYLKAADCSSMQSAARRRV